MWMVLSFMRDMPMRQRAKIVIAVLSLLLVAATCFSIREAWKETIQRKQEQETFEMLDQESALQAEKAEAEADKPKSDAAEVVCHDIAHLRASNPDCIGWLSIPDTCISYPVMLTPDEPQRYLHRDFYGSYSYAGVPFLDYHCTTENHNLIIYGHNMRDGSMFGGLKAYLDRRYLTAHQKLYFETSSGMRTFKVFAVAQLNKTDAWYSFLCPATAEVYDTGIQTLLSKAALWTGQQPRLGDQILTLSTCADHDQRLVVAAVEERQELLSPYISIIS